MCLHINVNFHRNNFMNKHLKPISQRIVRHFVVADPLSVVYTLCNEPYAAPRQRCLASHWSPVDCCTTIRSLSILTVPCCRATQLDNHLFNSSELNTRWAFVTGLRQLCVVRHEQFLQTSSLPEQLPEFQIILQECSFGLPSTKIAQTVPLSWTRWPPEL